MEPNKSKTLGMDVFFWVDGGILIDLFSPLPDGRIFGQITQKRPKQNFHGRKKLEAVKLQNFDKCCRKGSGKYFNKYFEEKPYNSLYFLRFFP
jgi:hypothetical protein